MGDHVHLKQLRMIVCCLDRYWNSQVQRTNLCRTILGPVPWNFNMNSVTTQVMTAIPLTPLTERNTQKWHNSLAIHLTRAKVTSQLGCIIPFAWTHCLIINWKVIALSITFVMLFLSVDRSKLFLFMTIRNFSYG